MEKKVNWYNQLKEICKKEVFVAIAVRKNSYDNTESYLFESLKEAKQIIDYDFDSGYGGTEGPHFTMWTEDSVYFPASYDGAEWIEKVPRNPIAKATEHIGGG